MLNLSRQHKNMFPLTFANELKKMIRQIRVGTVLKGRVADCLGDDRYILEIRGLYILSESYYSFYRGEEAWLIVRSVEPNFILEMVKEKFFEKLIDQPGQTNLLVL